MPPKVKDGASKKNEKKKKEKLLEDRTFGLKNKNKSKKVQQFIQGVAANVYTVDPKQRRLEEERKKLKENAKLHKKALEEEQNALFGAALLAVQKKGAAEKGKVEAKGRDAEDDGAKKAGTSRAMKMMFQMDAQEMDEKLKEDVSETVMHSFVIVVVEVDAKSTNSPYSIQLFENHKAQLCSNFGR